jgi:hypothetical protein
MNRRSSRVMSNPSSEFTIPDSIAQKYEELFAKLMKAMTNRQSSIENRQSKDFLFLQLRDLPYFRAFLRAVESSYYQNLPMPAPVYDVGCGDGHFASLTFDQKIDVGLDPWHGPIHEAKKFGAYKSLVESDGSRCPVPFGILLERIQQLGPRTHPAHRRCPEGDRPRAEKGCAVLFLCAEHEIFFRVIHLEGFGEAV